MKPPTGIERLTPAEAWQDGYRAGRESLALSYQHDKEIREQKEGRTLERIDDLERAMIAVQGNAGDMANSVADALRRIGALEGSSADAVRPTRRITRTNGPAPILSVRPEHTFHGGCLLMVPKIGYDSMIVNAAWTTSDNAHRARLVVLKTYDHDPSDKSLWKDITLGYTEKKSEYTASPQVGVSSQQLALWYDDIAAPFVGFRLETDPLDTNILASLVVTLYSHEEVDPR